MKLVATVFTFFCAALIIDIASDSLNIGYQYVLGLLVSFILVFLTILYIFNRFLNRLGISNVDYERITAL